MINRYEWLESICEDRNQDTEEVMDMIAENLGMDRDENDDEDILRETSANTKSALEVWLINEGIIGII